MKRVVLFCWVLGTLALASVACNSTSSSDQAVVSPGTCPTAEGDTLLFTYEAQGYCVLYPSTHQPLEATPAETVFAVGSLLDVSNPRVSISVTDAGGLDTDTAAAQTMAAFSLPDTSPPTSITLGGSPAILLDNMPGQDINRRVITVHGGRLYDLTFSPIGADYGELGEQTELVYQMMVDSFTFLP